MAKVSLQRVNKIFDETVHAVKDFSLEIDDREFLVLLGPSGCGKTTLLRMIAGLETVTSGAIYVDDRLVNFVPPKDRDIAMVFQNYALYPHMDVTDNLALALRLRSYPKPTIKERIQETSLLLRVGELLKRFPRQLSGGQQQRVALGRAIVREPKVFLMDEPLSNLDARLRVQMRTELIKLHRRLKTTVIYVTHDQSEAMTMATRIAVMREGVLQQCDTPLNVYRHPVNKYVAGFMGSPEMNFLACRVRGEGGELVISGVSFEIPTPPQRQEALAPYRDKEIIVGIRPEALTLEPPTSANPYSLPATVDVVEPLGNRTLVHALVKEETIVAEVPSDVEPKIGEEVRLAFEPGRVHAFEGSSEEALW